MEISIEVCIKEGESANKKGELLEKLTGEILKVQQYNITQRVRVTGMEIDVLAQNKINNDKILVECKAWESPLPADVISKLLGNVELRLASAGWLITTGGLSKDAEGIKTEWESRNDEKRNKLSFYTSDRIIELLVDSGKIKDINVVKSDVEKSFQISDKCTLMITDKGMYWLIPVINDKLGLSTSIVVINAKDGKRIVKEEKLAELQNYKNKYSEYQWLAMEEIDKKIIGQISDEYNSIVPVISGDDWKDYRPARPEDFIGRKNILDDIMVFLENVNRRTSSTRLFSIKAPSGMGKSSLVLKIASLLQKRNKAKNYFVYAVDVRTAISSRYVEMVVKSCFDEADKKGFTDIKNRNINFSNIKEYMYDESIQKTLDYLNEKNKTVVIIFDQFEELFSKKELYGLFENMKILANIIDSIQGQIVLGFSWKTDLTIPADHPAYYMWSNLADRRKEFELTQFKASEIKSAINLFGNQLGEKINPILKNYLIKQCQGYPWLLKKLCIHVFRLINEGNSQDSVIGQRLNIVDLFERDLSDLTPEQNVCLNEIARNSPADYFMIADKYGSNILKTLIDNRIVIRRASKLTLYWDIFRDYVVNKTIPELVLDYIPQQQFVSTGKVLNYLLRYNNVSIEELSSNVNMRIKTLDNVMIDAVMFGLVKKENGIIILLPKTEEEIIALLQSFFMKHIMYKKLLYEIKDSFDYLMFSDIFNTLYKDSNLNKKTKMTYCSKLYNWMAQLGLFESKSGKNYLVSNVLPKNISLVNNDIIRRGRLRHNNENEKLFWGQTSPDKVNEVYKLIQNGSNDYNMLKQKGYRNAIEILSITKAIEKNNNQIKLNKTLPQIYEYISSSETIRYVQKEFEKNPNLKGLEIGQLLNDKFCRNWTDASKKRYGGALILWLKYLKDSMLLQ